MKNCPIHRVANNVVNVNGLPHFEFTVIHLPSIVGIDDNIQSKMVLYPNPCSGIVTILSTNHTKFDIDITIVDANGKTIINLSCGGSGFYTFDLSNKSARQYLLRQLLMQERKIGS
ncbi:MAG: hypothetical protein IPH84_15165 [Bacteroidales bacterium]|nr:hypothetical protein [Bacteroidales bacterium]